MTISLDTTTLDKALLVFAMEEESKGHFEHYDVLHTGIGKVNATYALTKALSKNKPPIVINLGTAGSPLFPGGSVVCCMNFIQRDMDVQSLGFKPYQTPFSDIPVVIEYGETLPDLPLGTCGSGDNFEIAHDVTDYNVIDMEAYALARVCQNEGIPFLCLKYISDGADSDASNDWQESLNRAAAALEKALLSL